MDFMFNHSTGVNISRRCVSVESRPFAAPPMSAFQSFHEQRGGKHQQFGGCDAAFRQEAHNQTGASEDDDEYNRRGTEHSVEMDHTDDGMRHGSGERGDSVRLVTAGDRGGPASQQQTSRKHDYSVAQLLRNDRPSFSAVYDDQPEAGQSDSYRHAEPSDTSPTQTAHSAFYSWNVDQVDRSSAPLPPPFALSTTSHHHRWAEWMLSDTCRRAEFDNEAQRRFFGLFDVPPINFVSTYGPHLRRGKEHHLPSSTFGQEYSIPPRSRNRQLKRTFSNVLSYSTITPFITIVEKPLQSKCAIYSVSQIK